MASLAIKTLAADGYTDAIRVRGSKLVDVSISANTASTINIQRSADGTNWHTIESYASANAERVLQSGAFGYFRVGGTWVSGSPVLRIEAGNAY